MSQMSHLPIVRRFEPWHDRIVSAVPWALAVLLGIGVGLAATRGPLTIVAVLAAAALAWVLVLGPRIVPTFHLALAAILIGYAFLNRGFAYIGVGSVFVGEVVVGLAVITLVVRLPRARFGLGEAAILAFMAWGAARTIPYLGEHGIDAIRDAVAWGYALIALAVSASLTGGAVGRAVRLYRRLALVAVLWFPVAAVASYAFGDALPRVPGQEIPLIYFKGGDAGVHLAGIAAFLFVGLYGARSLTIARSALMWAGWGASVALVAAVNRGGMAAASIAVLSLLFVRRLNQWIIAVCVAAVLLSGAWLANPEIDFGIQRRLSFQQLVENATSIFFDSGTTQTAATRAWRLDWWDTIIEYTVAGPYLLEGKGYGVNLADSDGFQVYEDGSLRSPHSAHFEILARSGVTGLVLWILLNALVAVAILRAARKAIRAHKRWWLAVTAWLGVYWLAALVNMSVDVYLAGPMGGIWFWAVVGAILALSRLIEEPEPDDPDASINSARDVARRPR
jgi:hypothetical protein